MKAHQRIIRESKEKIDMGGLFGYPKNPDIKSAIIREIDYNTAKQIILEYEWLGTMGLTQIHYGIYFDGVCAGVNCFGYLVAMEGYRKYVGEKYKDKGIQLHRGACVWWAHEHSGSKLISESLKNLKKLGYKWVIAYSDSEAGEIGTLYQATNWYYLGLGNTTHFSIHRKDGKLLIDDADYYKKYKGIPYKKFVKENDLTIQYQSPKGRYMILIGDRRENKEMMKYLKDKIQPYPKRDI